MTRFPTGKIIDFKFTNRYLRPSSAPRLLLVRAGSRIQNPILDSSFSAQTLAPRFYHQHPSPDPYQDRNPRARNPSISCKPYPSFSARPPTLVDWGSSSKHLRAYNKALSHPTPVSRYQSAVGSWTLVGLVIVGLLYSLAGDNRSPEQQSPDTQVLPEHDNIQEQIRKMTGEELPGRPGTLTAAEEEKLRQFWIATFQVLGLIEAHEANGNGNGHADSSPSRARAETSSSKKSKPKKRMSMFRRGNREEDETETPTSPTHAPDSEDKYGQTKEFHDALANLSPETLRANFWSMMKQDNPDAFLLRFLRARKWDVEKALVMMVSTIRWRALDVHLDDDVMKNGELSALEDSNGSDPTKKRLGHDFLTQMRLGKSFLHGLDKTGRPMCFVRVRLHKAGEQTEESMERYTVFVIESARLLLNPPVDTAVSWKYSELQKLADFIKCVVFDMTDFSLANMVITPYLFSSLTRANH